MNSILTGALALVLLLGTIAGIYEAGKSAARRECQAASIQAKLDEAKRDLKAERSARLMAEAQGTDLENQANGSAARIKALEDELSKAGTPRGCAWTPDDARRELRGGPAPGRRVSSPPAPGRP
ncbi:MAG: hypothetical protein U1E62_21815 [Alsobacter sp.]